MTTVSKPLPSITIKVPTPDGTMFVIIVEENNQPAMVQIIVGKNGLALQAWADATAALCTYAIKLGAGINQLIEAVSAVTTDRVRDIGNGAVCRSGPEGLSIAFLKYRKMKNEGKHK